MARVVNTVQNLIMKRIKTHNYLILREAFTNRKAFLTFDFSSNESTMFRTCIFCWKEFPYVVILIIYTLPFLTNSQNTDSASDFEYFIKKAQDVSLSIETRKELLRESHAALKHISADSIKYFKTSKIVEISSSLKDSILFHSIASENHALAKTLDNPSILGDSHWNYGSYYLREHDFEQSYFHYNSAFKYFTSANSFYYAGKMLYNMAYISRQSNDFTGAEILLFRSIKIFESTNNIKQLYRCYNLLGNNSDDLEEFQKSLNYYNEAARMIPKLENSEYYQLENLNNLGVRLYKMKLYKDALAVFNNALAYPANLKLEPSLHARLLDNSAFCQISIGRYEDVAHSLKFAMALRDSIEDTAGSVMSRMRLALYYAKVTDTIQAIDYAKEGLRLAKGHYLNSNVLYGLELLAALDTDNTNHYLTQHISLNKSLNTRDRRLRNKFTAIQYETDKYIQENERLFSQRMWIFIIAISVTTILVLIYINSRQNAKNKELLFEREQQQYNEDMFLMALSQKTNLEKGKLEERQRISQELHDDIVSRLFTLRFRWQSVKLSGAASMEMLHQQFLVTLEQLETDIRNLSHELREIVFFQEDSFSIILKKIGLEKSEIGKFEFYYHCNEPEVWERLPYVTQIQLRRLFEEVLQNVVKHAQASKVNAHLYRELDILNIEIKDNGMGFNPTKSKIGIGMKSLKTRSQKLKGKFDIHAPIGVGTTISIQIPFNPSLP